MPRKKKELNPEYVLKLGQAFMCNDNTFRELILYDTDVLYFKTTDTITGHWSILVYTHEGFKDLMGLDKNTKLVIRRN